MLKVVSKTCSLCRVVLTTHTHRDNGLNSRLLLIYREIDLQSVVKRIDASTERIALDLLVAILRAR